MSKKSISISDRAWSSTKYMPNLEPSRELSYLLGVRYGDMILTSCSKTPVQLAVKDEDFAEEFAYCLGKVMENTYKVHLYGNKYTVGTCSHILYNYLVLPLEDHAEQIEVYPNSFIRGFADSEGSVFKGYQTYHPMCPMSRISLLNSDTEILNYSQALLSEYFSIHSVIGEYDKKTAIGTIVSYIHGYPVIKRKRKFALCINRREDQRVFYKYIGFSIMRKQKRLEEIFSNE